MPLCGFWGAQTVRSFAHLHISLLRFVDQPKLIFQVVVTENEVCFAAEFLEQLSGISAFRNSFVYQSFKHLSKGGFHKCLPY